MEKTPKSLRLQIGLFGRTNVGKSSFLNLVAGQDVALLCIREQSVDGFVPIAAIFPERRQTLIVRLSPDGELNLEDRTEQHPEWN